MNKLVFNPYRAVDWAAFTQYKGNYHCHVMQCRRIEKPWVYDSVTYPAGTIFYRNGMIQNPDGSYDSTYLQGSYPWWSDDPEWEDAECYQQCGGTFYGSDGYLYIKERLEKYAERNFDFIALAGHDNTTPVDGAVNILDDNYYPEAEDADADGLADVLSPTNIDLVSCSIDEHGQRFTPNTAWGNLHRSFPCTEGHTYYILYVAEGSSHTFCQVLDGEGTSEAKYLADVAGKQLRVFEIAAGSGATAITLELGTNLSSDFEEIIWESAVAVDISADFPSGGAPSLEEFKLWPTRGRRLDTQNSPWSYFGFDAEANGMLELYGKELSREHHHVSLFTEYADTAEGIEEEESFMQVADEMGVVHLAHPGRYHDDLESHPWATIAWYVDLYSRIHNLHALEIVNSDDAYPNDRVLWDEILSQLMPLRPVFGCANDDAHSQNADGKAFSMALAEDLTKGHIRQAIVRGSTYCISMPEGYEVSDHVPSIAAPTINSISVDEERGTITIDASNHTAIHWYSGTESNASGKVSRKIASGSTFNYAYAGELKYIRAEVVGEQGEAYTQPFGLSGGKSSFSGSGKYPPMYP